MAALSFISLLVIWFASPQEMTRWPWMKAGACGGICEPTASKISPKFHAIMSPVDSLRSTIQCLEVALFTQTKRFQDRPLACSKASAAAGPSEPAA